MKNENEKQRAIGKIDMNGVCELCATLHAHITLLHLYIYTLRANKFERLPFFLKKYNKWNMITREKDKEERRESERAEKLKEAWT